MNKKIKYIAFYDNIQNKKENRQNSLAASNKIDYICSCINKADYKVEIISPSWSNNDKGFYKQRTEKINKLTQLRMFNSFGTSNKVLKMFKYMWSLIQLLIYLLKTIKEDEKIIVYHSIILIMPILLIKKIKKFHLVLEVEEVYYKVFESNKFNIFMENLIFKRADSFLFANDSLNDLVNIYNKPAEVIYGVYSNIIPSDPKKENNKITVVYAGVIDTIKNGAFNAISAAKFLNENYILKVIGFGSEEDIKLLNETIDEFNKSSRCQIVYDGVKSGKEYINYITDCEIGLSKQRNEGEYLLYTFPSKILSYMSMGLRVVSPEIECVIKSRIGDLLYYYKEETPEKIAEAIMKIEIAEEYDSRSRLVSLDKDLIASLLEFLK